MALYLFGVAYVLKDPQIAELVQGSDSPNEDEDPDRYPTRHTFFGMPISGRKA